MNDLHKALGDISSIRRQVARNTEFRGYGPATLATTGAFAVVAACVQSLYVSDPAGQVSMYLAVWISAAGVSAVLTGVQMFNRSRRMHSVLSQEMIQIAVEQFLPAAVAGVLITVVLVRYAPTTVWMLPGLWQIVYALGVFASCRFLPKRMVAAGAWYLFSGLVCLSLGDSRALSPWAMGIPFAFGQSLIAAVLYVGAQESGAQEANDEV